MKTPRSSPKQLVLPFLQRTSATKWFDMFHHKLTEAAGFEHVSAPNHDNDAIIVNVTSGEARDQLLQALSQDGGIPEDVRIEVNVTPELHLNGEAMGDPRND